MKPFISTKLYGFINYACAILLLTSPWLFGFDDMGGAAFFMPILIGWLQLIMAIFSITPLGLIRVFPLQMHTCLNVLPGSFLLSLPWIYHFSGSVWLPHFVLGLLLCLNGIFVINSPFLTRATPSLPEAGITSVDAHEGRLNH
ncbi:MAG: hypothetical protein EOP47_13365 [Sphingobacteriaceae bacterium]|nr:MAG: hypothetical protein EOP47_13365 [Sphingobacteriaceae bacterium]